MSPVSLAELQRRFEPVTTLPFWSSGRPGEAKRRTQTTAVALVVCLHVFALILALGSFRQVMISVPPGNDDQGLSVGLVGNPSAAVHRSALPAAATAAASTPVDVETETGIAATTTPQPTSSSEGAATATKALASGGESLWGQAAAGPGKIDPKEDSYAKASLLPASDIVALGEARLWLQVDRCAAEMDRSVPMVVEVIFDQAGRILGEPQASLAQGEVAPDPQKFELAKAAAVQAVKACGPYVVTPETSTAGIHHIAFVKQAGGFDAARYSAPTQKELSLP